MAYVWTTNTSPATPADAIFRLKATLKTAGWTVISSSDGTTYNAAGDQITVAASGAGGMDNSKAWFNIRSPAGVGGQSFTFQRDTSGATSGLQWRIKYSTSAGFSGGTPGILQTPSATDEGIVLGGASDAAPTFAATFALSASFRWSVGADNAAPYSFWAGGWANGSGPVNLTNGPPLIMMDPIVSGTGQAADVDQTVISITGIGRTTVGQGQGSMRGSMMPADTASAFPFTAGWYRKGLSGAIFDLGTFGIMSWATQTGSYFIVGESGGPLMVSSIYTSKDDLLLGCWIHNNRTTAKVDNFKGVSTLIRLVGSAGRNNGDTYTVISSRDRVVIDDITLPWDGSVPTI